jgi:hypothetical protein
MTRTARSSGAVSRLNDVPRKADSRSTPPDKEEQAPCQSELEDKFPVCNEISDGAINRQMVLLPVIAHYVHTPGKMHRPRSLRRPASG